MTTNREAIEFLDYYCSPETRVDYAVMLDGPWGSGKTHFIKTYFAARADATQETVRSRPGHMYASLYGVQSTKKITDQFFAQAHPVLTSRAARVFGSALSGAASESSGVAGRELLLGLGERVLVFDDLERCGMNLADVMGFINAFVEHEGMKVIVIANQDEIPAGQRGEYDRRKEKLVGKTLRVRSEPHEVYDLLTKDMRDERARSAATREKDSVLRTFQASGRGNLRSLRSVLSDFDRLVSSVDTRLRTADRALSRLLHFMVAAGLEYRAGCLSHDELAGLSSSLAWSKTEPEERSQDLTKVEELRDTYPDVDWDDPVIPPRCLAVLFSSGIVEADQINEHLETHPLVVGYAETPAWRQLWNWTDLTRTQYEAARARLLGELADRRLVHPGVILHVAGEIIGFEEQGDSFLGAGVDVVAYFRQYLDDLQRDKRLEPARDALASDSYAGLAYHSHNSDRFQIIARSVEHFISKAFDERMRDEAAHLLGRLRVNPETASDALIEYGVDDQRFGDAALLHYIPVSAFADLLFVDSHPQHRLLASLMARYAQDAHVGALVSEHAWVRALHQELQERSSCEKPPHKRLLEVRVGYVFSRIEQHFSEAVQALEGQQAAQ